METKKLSFLYYIRDIYYVSGFVIVLVFEFCLMLVARHYYLHIDFTVCLSHRRVITKAFVPIKTIGKMVLNLNTSKVVHDYRVKIVEST